MSEPVYLNLLRAGWELEDGLISGDECPVRLVRFTSQNLYTVSTVCESAEVEGNENLSFRPKFYSLGSERLKSPARTLRTRGTFSREVTIRVILSSVV